MKRTIIYLRETNKLLTLAIIFISIFLINNSLCAAESYPYLGVKDFKWNDADRCLVVTAVDPDTIAFTAGIQAGDNICMINMVSFSNEKDAREILSKFTLGEDVTRIYIKRNGEKMTIKLTLEDKKESSSLEQTTTNNKNIRLSFANIKWTDTIKEISKKLQATGSFSSIRELQSGERDVYGRSQTYIHFDNNPTDGGVMEKEYESACQGAGESESLIYQVNSDRIKSKDNPFYGADFFFSTSTGSLLYYRIFFHRDHVQDIYNSLVSKYGSQYDKVPVDSPVWMIWRNDSEIMYFQGGSTGYDGKILKTIYINPGNIQEKIKRCRAISDKNNQKAKSKVKLF